MRFYSAIVLVMLLTQGYALQCYDCKNCTSISEGALQSCPQEPGSTTLAPPTSTTESSSSTTVTEPSTTIPSVTTPTVTTTTPTVTTPTVTTTTVTTPTVTTTTVTTSTTPASPGSTDSSSTGTPSTATTDAPEQGNYLSDPGVLVYRHLRFVRDTARQTKYSCYKHEYEVDGQTIIDRGCTSDQELCKDKEGCTLCSKDKCNSATLLRTSMAILLPALVLRFTLFS